MYFGGVASHSPPPAFLRLAAHPLRWRLLTALATSDHRVRDLVTLTGEPQNLVSYHLRLLRQGGLATTTRSTFDGRDTYYHLDLDRCADALTSAGAALHPALRPAVVTGGGITRARVLFVCTGNSARSPIAEALLRHRTGHRVEVTSAGNRPRTGGLHPHTVRVLRDEYGIDVSGRQPRHWDTLTGRRFDYVISLCDRAREACPDFPGDPRRAHWSLPAPGDYADHVRIAADIDTRIRHLRPLLEEAQP
ncbi:ArsR family transcriptional regulator [Actinoplanes sp. NEAU-A11]|uniref:ArsR family transcriptional regulator n=1 Tax=Actinoplanes aureus TaxID=2792083 RepID=A0A931CG23_9ACTN|nr:ArsR family transcriptional regulator [Actinoplanes aureus]